MPDRVSPAFIDEQAEVTPEMWSYLMDRVSPASPVRMDHEFGVSHPDLPFARAACKHCLQATIEAQQSTIQQLREALEKMDRRFRMLLARQEHFPDSEDEKALDMARAALARSDGQEPR
jgi:hypothetical protein